MKKPIKLKNLSTFQILSFWVKFGVMNNLSNLLAIIFVAVFASSCASHYSSPLIDDPYALPEITDPREAANRAVLEDSLEANRAGLGEFAEGYREIPSFFRDRLRDFNTNMGEFENFTASLLQGKGEKALRSLMRFTFNTIFGLFGTIDIASSAGVPPAGEDMGQVFAHWGWQEGIYLVLPLVGPTTSRDFLGSMVGFFLRPTSIVGLALGGPYLALLAEKPITNSLLYLENTEFLQKLEASAIDPYISFKSYYLNRRHLLILDETQ